MESQNLFGQKIRGRKPDLCFVCRAAIKEDQRASWYQNHNYALCMGCEGAQISVYEVREPDGGRGYVVRDHIDVALALENMDVGDRVEVRVIWMLACEYLSLPEFQGF
jgi:hypothetical protein